MFAVRKGSMLEKQSCMYQAPILKAHEEGTLVVVMSWLLEDFGVLWHVCTDTTVLMLR
jgi:hypothetical protein